MLRFIKFVAAGPFISSSELGITSETILRGFFLLGDGVGDDMICRRRFLPRISRDLSGTIGED